MDKQLLRSVMILNGDTNKTLADFLKISVRSICDKINEHGTEFKQSEISLIKQRYNLTDEMTIKIFFNEKVS